RHATKIESCISRTQYSANVARGRTQAVLLRPGHGSGSVQPAPYVPGRHPDLRPALLVCTLGHRDRSADSSVHSQFVEGAHAVRPDEILARADSEAAPCLGWRRPSRATARLVR